MTSRDQFIKLVKQVAIANERPPHAIFTEVYKILGKKNRVNLWAAAKDIQALHPKTRPLDLVEKWGWLPGAIEIATNMLYRPDFTKKKQWRPAQTRDLFEQAATRTKQPPVKYIDGCFVDTATGEIIE